MNTLQGVWASKTNILVVILTCDKYGQQQKSPYIPGREFPTNYISR